MSESLSLHEHLLDRGRHLVQLGQTADARDCLRRVSDSSAVAVPVRSEAFRLLGRLELTARNYRRARRHFVTAIRLRPYHAESYYGYASAVEGDANADARKGRAALRKAVQINAGEPRYWTALGRACIRVGDMRTARKAFRRAARLRPDDLHSLGAIVDGFMRLGRIGDARLVLQAARFRSPKDAGLRGLWDRFRFDRLRRRQETRRRPAGAMILAFPGRSAEPAAAPAAAGIVRVDRASHPAPHLLRLGGFRAGPRQVR